MSLPSLATSAPCPASWELFSKLDRVGVVDVTKHDGARHFTIQLTLTHRLSERFEPLLRDQPNANAETPVICVTKQEDQVLQLQAALERLSQSSGRASPWGTSSTAKKIIDCHRCDAVDTAIRSVKQPGLFTSSEKRGHWVAELLAATTSAVKIGLPLPLGSHVCKGCTSIPFVLAKFLVPGLPDEAKLLAAMHLQEDVTKKTGRCAAYIPADGDLVGMDAGATARFFA